MDLNPAVYEVFIAGGTYTNTAAFSIPTIAAFFGGYDNNGDGGRNATTTLTEGVGGSNVAVVSGGAAILDGFTINNASGNDGAGVLAINSNVLMLNMQFMNNSAVDNGGAIYAVTPS